MTDDPLNHEAFQSTLEALSTWARLHPCEDRDPIELLESDDFKGYTDGSKTLHQADDDSFGAGILDKETP